LTLYDRPAWKSNWDEARKHYEQWWRREGPVLLILGLPPLDEPRDRTPLPPDPKTNRARHTDPEWFAWNQRLALAERRFPADNLPIAFVEHGCVQLAACFGAEPEFDDRTVWYADCVSDPEAYPPLALTKTEPWWQTYKQIMQRMQELSWGDFLVGMPAFGSNLDVLAELRGTQALLYDLVDRPGWVSRKLEEINQAFFTAYDDYYDCIRLSDGSSAYTFFQLWAPGKVSQVQCDFAAMISPGMFEKFVVPALGRQCAWLDRSLFHLDGPSCICHLTPLLVIPELDAVQWTPGASQPGTGDTQWYHLYERILAAGKSVQILGVNAEQARHILKTFGAKGVFLSVHVTSETEGDSIIDLVESMR